MSQSKHLKILAYRGKSLISRAIRFQTRSNYSHIAVSLPDGSVIEAWHVGGVRHVKNASVGHTPGTQVDVFDIAADYDQAAVIAYLKSQVGKKYDFRSILRFISRRDDAHNDKFFCSELSESALLAGGLRLLNGRPSHHSPRDTVMSPYLIHSWTFLTV